MSNVIEIENLWKEYRLGVIGHGTLYRDLQSWWARVRGKEDPNEKISILPGREKQVDGDRFWALSGVDLKIQQGEVLGIIGKNGAGKSTLLKILSKVTAPTRGSIKAKGRIASLLEVGTGFHPELTGRENIFMNGAILGMSRAEIKAKLDEIIDFSGVEKYIDTPVKRYSSGMYVRLGFSVAAYLEPEILVVDEVLAVGDVDFQRKCLGKMKDISHSGRTVLFVSHNMQSIKNLCNKVVLIDHGQVTMQDDAEIVVAKYLDRNIVEGAVATASEIADRVEGVILKEFPYFRINEVRLEDLGGKTKSTFKGIEPVVVCVTFQCFQKMNDLRVVISIANEIGESILGSQNTDDTDIAETFYKLEPGKYSTKCTFPADTFGNRNYYVNIQMLSPKKEHHTLTKILEFKVDFPGYNPEVLLGGTHWAFLWPKLSWTVDKLRDQ
jgi:lipopolysaccharide transport system ATP-binding protein